METLEYCKLSDDETSESLDKVIPHHAKGDHTLGGKEIEEVRHVGTAEISQVEAARTNRHSGSAGGDQEKSCEINFGEYKVSRQSALNDLTQAAAKRLPDAIDRHNESATTQLAKPTELIGDPIGHVLADGLVPDQSTFSHKLTGLPTDVIDRFAAQELQKPGQLRHETRVEHSEPGALEGRDERLDHFKHARDYLLQTAGQRFGEEQVRALNVPPEDVGTALTVFLAGPQVVKLLGPDEARALGQRILVLGIAPSFGTAAEIEKHLSERHIGETKDQAAINLFQGATIGLVLERLPFCVNWVVGTGAVGLLTADQTLSPENRQRNDRLLEIYKHVGNASNEDLLKKADESSVLLGRVVYDSAFSVGTSGIGIPGGHMMGSSVAEKPGGWSNLKPGAIVEQLKKLPKEAVDALGKLLHGPAMLPESVYFSTRLPHGKRVESPRMRRGSLREVQAVEPKLLEQHPDVKESLEVICETKQINAKNARKIVDAMRQSLRPILGVANADDRNFAFGVLLLEDGSSRVFFATSSTKDVRGILPVPKDPPLPFRNAGVFNRDVDAEFRILVEVYRQTKESQKGKLLIFTEQMPCDSCTEALEIFVGHRAITVPKFKSFFKDGRTREEFNEKRTLE